MNFFKIDKFDSVDGPGIRVGLYLSGCTHKCPGCHSSEYWDFDTGKEFTNEEVEQIKQVLSQPHITGLSILGGDPLEEKNVIGLRVFLVTICTWYKDTFNKPLDVWLWTGSIYEEFKPIIENDSKYFAYGSYESNIKEIFEYITVLVDGPYIESERNLDLPYRGSENQRIIDMVKTKECKELILYEGV